VEGHQIKKYKSPPAIYGQELRLRTPICSSSNDDIFPLTFLFGVIEDPTFRRVVNEYFFSFVPLLVAEMGMTW